MSCLLLGSLPRPSFLGQTRSCCNTVFQRLKDLQGLEVGESSSSLNQCSRGWNSFFLHPPGSTPKTLFFLSAIVTENQEVWVSYPLPRNVMVASLWHNCSRLVPRPQSLRNRVPWFFLSFLRCYPHFSNGLRFGNCHRCHCRRLIACGLPLLSGGPPWAGSTAAADWTCLGSQAQPLCRPRGWTSMFLLVTKGLPDSILPALWLLPLLWDSEVTSGRRIMEFISFPEKQNNLSKHKQSLCHLTFCIYKLVAERVGR